MTSNTNKLAPLPMRQRLMDAARAEFGAKGIEAATTRGIAERAGCNEVTLFRHFSSKLKLLGEVVQDTSEEFKALCERAQPVSDDPEEGLGHFARVFNSAMERCEDMARALIGEGRRQPNLAKELIGNVAGPFHRSLADYLTSCQERGQLCRDFDPLAFAEIFTAALMGGCLRRTSGLSSLDRDAWLRWTVSLMLRGVSS